MATHAKAVVSDVVDAKLGGKSYDEVDEESSVSKATGTPVTASGAELTGWKLSLARWLGGEAGTNWDGWLLTVASQIGQIMLTLPNAYAGTGLIAGVLLTVGCGTISLWTMQMLIALYEQRKAEMVKAGTWFIDGQRTIVTQYHNVIGYFLGKWARNIVIVLVVTNLFGTNVSQIVASSSDIYYWDKSQSKRTYAIIFGSIFQIFTVLPGLRHFRLLNIIAIVGTTYTVWYIVGTCASEGMFPGAASRPPPSRQAFYTGTAVIYNALGGHVMALEIMDAMDVPRKYRKVYFLAFLYILSLTLPHSIAVQLTFPTRSAKNGNVFGVLPHNGWLKASIFLMLVHQAIAFALYFMPLCFIWEKLLRVHTKPKWIRIPLRLPLSALVMLFAVAFPYYGTINSLIGAIASPGIAYIFPSLTYMVTYRTKERQANMSLRPPKFLIWLGGGTFNFIFALNTCIILCWLINGTGFSLYYSIRTFIDAVDQFSVFPRCYQC